MTITVQQFRADYPEFSSSSQYPNSAITYWLNLAYLLLNPSRWGSVLDTGAELFVAHNVAIEARAQAEAANGGIPGGQVGPINSKSVDKVSISYDTSTGIQEGAGHWNLTVYGTRLIKLARMFGAGPIQVGIGYDPYGGGAWAGPDVTPSMTGFS
jgi:hypothetical protein